MIEGYFIKGTTFNWVAPSPITPPNRDGSVVQSGQNPGPAMTFAGLDHEILYGAMQNTRVVRHESTFQHSVCLV